MIVQAMVMAALVTGLTLLKVYHSCIRGYHYLGCIDRKNCETSDDYDDYAISVVHRGVIVGHVLRHLSQGFSLFLEVSLFCHTSVSLTIFKRPSTRRAGNSVSIFMLEGPSPCSALGTK